VLPLRGAGHPGRSVRPVRAVALRGLPAAVRPPRWPLLDPVPLPRAPVVARPGAALAGPGPWPGAEVTGAGSGASWGRPWPPGDTSPGARRPGGHTARHRSRRDSTPRVSRPRNFAPRDTVAWRYQQSDL